MQPFTCSQCGYQGSFDPWQGPAVCPQCDFRPATKGSLKSQIQHAQRYAYQPYLVELLSHWEGNFQPDPNFELKRHSDVLAFFQQYQDALAGVKDAESGVRSFYWHNPPTRTMILSFVNGFVFLRRGELDKAREQFKRSISAGGFPFADAWLWFSIFVHGQESRLHCLNKALSIEPQHPLAQAALAIFKGEIRTDDKVAEDRIELIQCSRCGGELRYQPGDTHVECVYCDTKNDLRSLNLLDQPATSMQQVRLHRLLQLTPWKEIQKILSCQACGAELTMTKHLARSCNFCGSTNVLIEDAQRDFQQPDGVMPFKIDHKQASDAIQALQQPGWSGFWKWLMAWFNQGMTFLPLERPGETISTLKYWRRARKLKIGPLLGFYLPFWVYDGVVRGRQLGELGNWKITFDNIVFPAVSSLDAQLLAGIQPFEMGALVSYQPKLIANWPAQLYDTDVEIIAENAYSLMVELARQETNRSKASYQVTDSTYQLILLPVWAALLGRKEERVLALVNGQTRKVAFGEIH